MFEIRLFRKFRYFRRNLISYIKYRTKSEKIILLYVVFGYFFQFFVCSFVCKNALTVMSEQHSYIFFKNIENSQLWMLRILRTRTKIFFIYSLVVCSYKNMLWLELNYLHFTLCLLLWYSIFLKTQYVKRL